VLAHPKIAVVWNATVERFVGEHEIVGGVASPKLTRVELQRADGGVSRDGGGGGGEGGDGGVPTPAALRVAACFVAVGHAPNAAVARALGVALDEVRRS